MLHLALATLGGLTITAAVAFLAILALEHAWPGLLGPGTALVFTAALAFVARFAIRALYAPLAKLADRTHTRVEELEAGQPATRRLRDPAPDPDPED